MNIKLSPKSLATASSRHPWIAIAIWIIVLALAILSTSKFLKTSLTTEESFTNNMESKLATGLLKKHLPSSERITEIVVIKSKLRVEDAAYKKFVYRLYKDITRLEAGIVEGAANYYQTENPLMVSADRHISIMPIIMAGQSSKAKANIGKVHQVINKSRDEQFKILITGAATLDKDLKKIAEEDLRSGESYGILAAIIILVLVSGTVVSAVIPFLIAAPAIVTAVGISALVGQTLGLSFFIVNIITMMGLAVGIDYSLFIITRYREERAHGLGKFEAISTTGATASRTVLFSGLMVILSMLGMLIVPHSIFRSTALGSILVVIAALAASLTLLPAFLSLIGNRINALSLPISKLNLNNKKTKSGFWSWLTKLIMRHPLSNLVIAAGILIILSTSYLNIKSGMYSMANQIPNGLQSKEAYLILNKNFSLGRMSEAKIVINGQITKSVKNAIENLKSSLKSDPSFGPGNAIYGSNRNIALVKLPVLASSDSQKAIKAIRRLRLKEIPKAFKGIKADVLVTGETADTIDFLKMIKSDAPLVLTFVLGLSFILLTVVFRSLVVPIKAIIMNLLSLGAAYGLIVLVFQKGFGAKLLGFQQVSSIEAFVPLWLFSVLFGLSMDYHVFLLSRIREWFDATKDNAESVAFGLQSTGRIITGAAFIMVAVFLGFAHGRLFVLQQVGFGLAMAVFLDASIVRSIIVPASMKLLGNSNWYLPKLLGWLPRLNIEAKKVINDELQKDAVGE